MLLAQVFDVAIVDGAGAGDAFMVVVLLAPFGADQRHQLAFGTSKSTP